MAQTLPAVLSNHTPVWDPSVGHQRSLSVTFNVSKSSPDLFFFWKNSTMRKEAASSVAANPEDPIDRPCPVSLL